MEALRAAGRAVLRSPSLARHRLGVARLRRHQLPESWSDMREPLLEGMGFALKYLGMTLVEKPKGEDMASAAIHRILATARVGPKKFRKVILTVSPRGLSLQDAETKETIETISIYRISYCTTDKLQNKVFAYVAQNPQSGALECHAFLSPKKKIAQAVTLTVAQAFQVALDLWEAAQAGSREGEGEKKPSLSPLCPPVENTRPPGRSPLGSPPFKTNFEEEEEEDEEEEEEEDLNEAFSGCGGACVWGLPSCPLPVSGGLGLQPPQQLPASGDIFLRLLLLIFLLPLTVSSLLISSTASAAPCLSPTRTSCPHP
ncbi:low density lipoprotein receptor adapter protein 1-like isoform X4 [Podarcis muralis]